MTLKRLLMAASATALLSSPLLASSALAQAPGSAPPNSKAPTSPTNPPPSTPSAQAPAPSTVPAPAAAPAPAATPAASGDIVATLQAKGGFSTFLKAVEAAGLTETLKSTDVLAVFAPTDAAFAALPAGTVDAWLKPENKDKLRQTLLYHTIHAQVTSAQIMNRKGAVKSGANVDITLDGGGGKLKVDDANIVEADIKASNGTIFAIDKVLTPGGAPAAAPAAPAAPTGAMAANGSARFNPAYVVRAGWQDTAKPGSQSDAKDDAPPKDPKKPTTDPVMNPPADTAPPATTDDAPPADDAAPASDDKVTPPAATPATPAKPATPPTETSPAQPADPAIPAMPADMTHKQAGDPGVVSNTPVPNPPEKAKAKHKAKPHA